jgi:hypothetical protein
MTDIIRLRLTDEQAAQLAPLVTEAAKHHENVLFTAVALPFWAPDEGTIWDLQTVTLPARIGNKIVKLIRENTL